jgi:DNA-directed RNA polymerase subunit M/transcription elongation factor TFIIS
MRKFVRNKEDFICLNCGEMVKGTGYTNHCPSCLYSLHIDKNPGDRKEQCHGLMIPIDILTKGGEARYVVHECSKCKLLKKNSIQELDSNQAIINVMQHKVKREMMR